MEHGIMRDGLSDYDDFPEDLDDDAVLAKILERLDAMDEKLAAFRMQTRRGTKRIIECPDERDRVRRTRLNLAA